MAMSIATGQIALPPKSWISVITADFNSSPKSRSTEASGVLSCAVPPSSFVMAADLRLGGRLEARMLLMRVSIAELFCLRSGEED